MRTGALQAALYTKLTCSSSLVEALSSEWGLDPVFDHVPQVPDPQNDAYFPYITVSQVTANQWDTDGTNGASAIVQIDVWSRMRGLLQARDIAQRVYDLLHYQPLTITGATHIWTGVESVEGSTDPDGKTRRAMLTAQVVYDAI